MNDKQRIEKLERQVSFLFLIVQFLVNFVFVKSKYLIDLNQTELYDSTMLEILKQIENAGN